MKCSSEGDTPLDKKGKPKLHPIAYYSTTFTPTERNYDIYEQELLAVMKVLAHWRHYLGWTRHPFTILTDHANLQYWKAPQNLNRRTAHWHADLQEYDYEIWYILGKTNVPPNALSHPPGADHGDRDNQNMALIPKNKFKINWIRSDLSLFEKHSLMAVYYDHPSARHPGRDETL